MEKNSDEEIWFVNFPLEEDMTQISYWKQADLRSASAARALKIMDLLPKDFKSKKDNLHSDDLEK